MCIYFGAESRSKKSGKRAKECKYIISWHLMESFDIIGLSVYKVNDSLRQEAEL